MSSFRSIKGTFDILPYRSEGSGIAAFSSDDWQTLEETIRSVFRLYDFDEIRTPILESTELIARSVGEHTDIVSKEMFAFERGNDHYVLRPEITAPVMRASLQHNLQQQGEVQRLYYVGPCFRAERPQKGRFRQFHQFGCELIGTDDARADVEVILCMLDIYRAFGIDNVQLRVNSLGNPDARANYSDALRAYFMDHLDALSKASRARLDQNPLRILDTKDEKEKQLLADAPLIKDFLSDEDAEHFEHVCSALESVGIDFEVDQRLVRGLDYYTRTAFEIETEGLGAQSALAGGGRYDLLAEEIGSRKQVPAVGFAAGIERLLIALESQDISLPSAPGPDVFIATLGRSAAQVAFQLARQIRSKGLRTTFDTKDRSLKAQLRDANRRNARFVVIIGDEEVEKGVTQVKNMRTGEESAIPTSETAARLVDMALLPEELV